MKNNKPIKTVTRESVIVSQRCNHCDKEIKGNSKSMLEWNMQIHQMSHRKEAKKNE